MKFLFYPFILCLAGCGTENREDTIQREIRLKETRRGHEVVNLTINLEKIVADTSEIHYHANIRIKSKDSTLNDSIFLIKGTDGVLLPFSTKNP